MVSRSQFSLCRLCLSHGRVLVNILEDKSKVGFEVKESLEDLLRVEVLEGCKLPWVVCKTCIEKLRNFSDFKFKCLASNTAFIRRYTKRRHSNTTCRPRTQSKEMDTRDDIPRDPLRLSVDCSESDMADVETTKDGTVYCVISPDDEIDTKDDIPKDPLGESENGSEDDTGDGETATDLSALCEFSLEEGAPYYCHSKSPQSVDGPDDSAPEQMKKSPIVDDCGRLTGLDSALGEGKRPVKSQSARHVEKELARSMENSTGSGKTHVCNVCSKIFSRTSNLNQHMLTHTGEKPFRCDVCSKSFSVKSSFRVHMRLHTGKRPYACNECSKAFAQKTALDRHKRVHSGDKPYSCDVCSKSFSCSSTKHRHMLTHTGEKPFQCSICLKSYTQKHNLLSHLLQHSG